MSSSCLASRLLRAYRVKHDLLTHSHYRMYPADQVNGRYALPFCELGAALTRRVYGSAGADERRGGPGTHSGVHVGSHHTCMACAQCHAVDPYAVAPPRAGPVGFTFTWHTRHVQFASRHPLRRGSPRQLCILYSVPGLLCNSRVRTPLARFGQVRAALLCLSRFRHRS